MKHASPVTFAFAALAAAALASSAACTVTKEEFVVDPSLRPDSGVLPEGGGTEGGGGGPTSRVEGKTGDLFGSKTGSYAMVEDETGTVVKVGVDIPVKAFETAPANAPFQDDLVLEMPKVARDQTMLNHVRVNWLSQGHGPDPYGDAHFDMHFHRGTLAEVDAIACNADKRMPPATAIPPGYGLPELCVNAMGQHSWPKADTTGWDGSIIMGFFATKVAFIEPMISKAKLIAKKDFTLDIAKPQSTGGATTLYPRRMSAIYDAAKSSYAFEFDKFETID